MSRRRHLAMMRWFAVSIGMLMMPVSVPALWAEPREDAAAHAKICTPSNVASSYGLAGSGTIVSNPFDLPEGPVVTVGIITFAKDGLWVSQRSASINGQFIHTIVNTGSYTVYPDCTFTFVDDTNTVVQFVGVFVADREEGWFMATGEGIVNTYTMKRIQKKS